MNKLANIFGRKQNEEAKFCLKSRSWVMTGLHLESRSLGLKASTVCTSMSVPVDDNGENSLQQPRSQTLGKGLNNKETKGPTTLSLTNTRHPNYLKNSHLCLETQIRVCSQGCLIPVLYSEEGNYTFLTAQGKTGPSAPESKKGKDLLREEGSEGIDMFLGVGIDKGHPAYLIVKRHLHLPGLLLQG